MFPDIRRFTGDLILSNFALHLVEHETTNWLKFDVAFNEFAFHKALRIPL